MIKIKRPILICTLGYITGIIYGLYFKKSIAFVFVVIYSIYLICRFNNYRIIKLVRYLKILLKYNVVLIFCISAMLSNTYLLYINFKYEKFYKNTPDLVSIQAIVIGECVENDYNYTYIIKIKEGDYKNKKFILTVKKDKTRILQYGDLIELKGKYIIPSESRIYKGFNYREYLKTKKIYGTIKSNNNKIKVLEKRDINPILILSNDIKNAIIQKSKKILPNKTSGLLIGILLGNKSGISEDVIENFEASNLSHLLAVSGAHVSYVILGISYILSKSRISKRWIYIITIFILIIFMFTTNFTSSVTRACLMGSLTIGAKVLHRRSNIITSIALSILITLIVNPFLINEIGLQLSYLGTLGIILFNKNIDILLSKLKINKKIIKLLAVTFSAQIMIMPIVALRFNSISLTFFVSNLLASPILGLIIILGFITILVSFISFSLAKLLAIVLNLGLEILILIANLISQIPLSNILVKTPYVIVIILVYLFILIFNYIYTIYNSKNYLRRIQKEVIKILTVKNIRKFLILIVTVIILFNLFFFLYTSISQNLKIYFVDVGQGDSCLIVTPKNKKILIDGGEGKTEALLSYLLDRRIKKIDYIIISHFDSDHCNGLIDVIENLNVKNIVISKQSHLSDEYINIAKIINKKRINVIHVKQGDRLNIDDNVSIDIFYPLEDLEFDDLNNNSIVAKISYNNFSILFTRGYRKSGN